MIYIDASELRSTSRLGKFMPGICKAFDTSEAQCISASLERLTGADVMVTPLVVPVKKRTLPIHLKAGASLVQLKFGRDLTGSLGVRLRDSLCRMRECGVSVGISPAQCILLFIGQLGVNRNGNVMIDGRSGRPRRGYMAVQKGFLHWIQEGGSVHELSRATFLPKWLKMLEEEWLAEKAVWPEVHNIEEPEDTVMGLITPVKRITDWRVQAAAIPGLGPVAVTNFRDAMLAEVISNFYILLAVGIIFICTGIVGMRKAA